MSNLSLVERLVKVINGYVPFDKVENLAVYSSDDSISIKESFFVDEEKMFVSITCHEMYRERLDRIINGKETHELENIVDNVAKCIDRYEIKIYDDLRNENGTATVEEIKSILYALRNNSRLAF